MSCELSTEPVGKFTVYTGVRIAQVDGELVFLKRLHSQSFEVTRVTGLILPLPVDCLQMSGERVFSLVPQFAGEAAVLVRTVLLHVGQELLEVLCLV